jgi:tetratricopeptide (TPR) repeat protein
VLLLESLLEEGAGTIVLLGEAGVGKTRLAVEAARLAHARAAAVLCGSGGATPPTVPYGILADAFREEARAGTHTDPFAESPAPPGASQEVRRRALFQSVRTALAEIAAGRPVLLLLDDLHLADESSLNLVHYLARQARALRLILVCTCREEAVHAGTPIQMALAHLDCERLGRGVRVPRLGLAAVREQIQDLLGGDAPEPVVAQVYRAADGSPALTEEVVRAWIEGGRSSVPTDPEAAVRGRLARLGPAAEALLAAAAAAGPRFELEIVRPVSGLSGHDALGALDACLEARLLDEDGGGHHFHHALAREAVYRGLSRERRRVLHAALASALESRAALPEGPPVSAAVAWHWRQADQPERAVRHLLAAGHRAMEQAGLAEAAACFGAALALPGRGGAERIEVLDALGRAQLALGELSAAVRSFSEAVEAAAGSAPGEAEQRARSRRLAALALAAAGHLEDADAEIELGLADARAGAPDEAAGLLHLRAQMRWHEGRVAEALEAAESCAEAARQAGDADLFARGRDLAALARTAAGRALPPLDDATTPEDRRRQDRAPEHPFDVHLVLWDRDLLADRGRPALERAASLLLERSRQRGAGETAASALLARGTAALAGGRLDLAEASLREALDLFREAGSALGEALALERLGTLLTVRGLLDPGLDAIAAGVVAAERGLLRRHALVRLHAAEARNRLAAGAVYTAEDAAREASASAALHGECVGCDAAFRPELIRVALARGRVAEAETEAAQLEEIARRHGGRGLRALARLSRARVLAARDRTGEALSALGEARADLVAAGLDLEAARCVRLAARLGLSGGWPEGGEGEAALALAEEDV